jgi:predicted methyltransferase
VIDLRILAVIALAAMPAAAAGPQALPTALPAPARPVAPVVSNSWGSEDARDRVGEAAAVLRIVGIRAGMNVADIGTGTGYYAIRLARVVGPQGRVFAQDIDSRALAGVKTRAAAAGLANVVTVRGGPANARLPPRSVDVALMMHMYHEIAQPYLLLDRLRRSLRDGGRIVVVDMDRAPDRHGMPRPLLLCEVRAVGYELVSIDDLPQGYIAIFRPGLRPEPRAVKACRA